MSKELTIKELRFASLYAETGNATQAAYDAGFKSTNRISMAQRAYQLLRNPQIRQQIRAWRKQACEAEGITTNMIVSQLARIAFAKRTSVFGKEGEVLPVDQWPEEVQAIVTSYQCGDITRFDSESRTKLVIGKKHNIKFANPIEALKTLAFWMGMIGKHANHRNDDLQQLMISGEASPDNLIPQ